MVTTRDIGQRVQDHTGRIGILRDVMPDWEDPSKLPSERRVTPTAFVQPEGGGPEWLLSPKALRRA